MATATDDGVAATTTTSRLRAMMVEWVMALVFDGGVAAMAGDGGVATTAVGNRCRLVVTRLQGIYNFLFFHAIILYVLDV